MKNLFYIVEVNEGWYNLRVRQTHYCIACGLDKDKLLNKVYEYARKFKTEERLYSALNKLSDKGSVPPSTFNQMETLIREGKNILSAEIRAEIERAIKDNREDSPYNRAKKKTIKVTPKKDKSPAALSPKMEKPALKKRGKEEEVKSVGKITPRKVARTVVG